MRRMKLNRVGVLVTMLLLVLAVVSCGRIRKQAKENKEGNEEKTTVTAIEQGSENQAKEDSIKRVKNELKKLPQDSR